MDREILTIGEEVRGVLRKSRHFRKKLEQGSPFSADDISREVKKLVSSSEELFHLHLIGANVNPRLRYSLRREIKTLVEVAIEVARRLEPVTTS